MFKSSKKKHTNHNNFDIQLDRQLNLIKQQNSTANNRNFQIANILDQALNQLKQQSQPSILHSSHKNYNPGSLLDQIRQTQILEIQKQSTIPFKEQIQIKPIQEIQPFASNPIWNLCSNQQVLAILQAKFSHYLQDQQIQTKYFIDKVVEYFTGLTVSDKQIDQISTLISHQITTTSSSVVSLNALQILAKKTKLQSYFIQVVIQAKIRLTIKDLDTQNRAISQQIYQKADKIALRERSLQQRLDSVIKKEAMLNQKDKTITNKQKDLLLKEQTFKKTIQERCLKLSEEYTIIIVDKVKEAEKKLAHLERNIKYKIQILERRAETLQSLQQQRLDLRNKKIAGDGQAKIKLRKLQKQLQNLQKDHKIQIQQRQEEQKDLLRNISILQQKVAKYEKKIHKLQDKLMQLQQQITTLKQQQERHIAQNSRPIQVITGNQKSTLERQQKNTLSQRHKKKAKNRNLQWLIKIYQYLLQIDHAINAEAIREIQLKIKQQAISVLPQILFLLCQNQQPSFTEPHYLIIEITKTIINNYCQDRKKEGRMYSDRDITTSQFKQITQLIQMPTKSACKISIYILLLPLIQRSLFPLIFVQEVFEQISLFSENNLGFADDLSKCQIKLLQSKESVLLLIDKFISPIPLLMTQRQDKSAAALQNTIKHSIKVIDFMISLSNKETKCGISVFSSLNCFCQLSEAFIDLMDCIFKLKSPKYSKANSAMRQLPLKYQQDLNELTEKLSILMQRLLHQTHKMTSTKDLNIRLYQIYSQLAQTDHYGGQKYSLVSANLKSILQMISQQL